MDILKLVSLCGNRVVWIQTHNFPDPDAIASAFGLQELLSHYGITARICHEGEIDKLSSIKMLSTLNITIFSYQEIQNQMQPEDMIILVDCQKNTGNTTDFIGDEVAVIDHHPVYSDLQYEYSDIRTVGACASLISEYFKDSGVEPSKAAATALLYGIRMDTLRFSRGVSELDIAMFDYLFPYISQKKLQNLETNNMEFEDLQAYGTAIKNIRIYGTVGFSYIDFSCPDALVAILSDFLLSLVEVDVVVLYAKRSNGYKFSFRSERKDANAGEIARLGLEGWGSGGGHSVMAGGFVKNSKIPCEPELFYETVQSHFVDLLRSLCPQVLD